MGQGTPEKKTAQEQVKHRIREGSPEALMIGSLIFEDDPHLCRIHQSAYERMPRFLCRALKAVDFDGDRKTISRRLLGAGLNEAEVDQLLDTSTRSFEAVRRRAPHTFHEGSGVSTPKPARAIFNEAHQAIMQQPKRKETKQ